MRCGCSFVSSLKARHFRTSRYSRFELIIATERLSISRTFIQKGHYMTTVTLKGKPVTVSGSLPKKGETALDFSLANKDLADVTLASYAGKRKVLNIVPSLDTPTCQNHSGIQSKGV